MLLPRCVRPARPRRALALASLRAIGRALCVAAESPTLSASIIVARPRVATFEDSYDYKVLLLRRSLSSSVLPGYFVFPGGHVDERDGDPTWRVHCTAVTGLHALAPASAEAAAAAAPGHETLACRIAAIRELFEETGLFLGSDRNAFSALRGGTVAVPGGECADWRQRVREDPAQLMELVISQRAPLPVHAVLPWVSIVTPVGVGRRFRTMFYLHALDDHTLARAVAGDAETGARDDPEATDAATAGWGRADETTETPELLREAARALESSGEPASLAVHKTGGALAPARRVGRLSVDDAELDGMLWLTPAQALSRHAHGLLPMAPPQLYLLSRMAGYRRIDQLMRDVPQAWHAYADALAEAEAAAAAAAAATGSADGQAGAAAPAAAAAAAAPAGGSAGGLASVVPAVADVVSSILPEAVRAIVLPGGDGAPLRSPAGSPLRFPTMQPVAKPLPAGGRCVTFPGDADYDGPTPWSAGLLAPASEPAAAPEGSAPPSAPDAPTGPARNRIVTSPVSLTTILGLIAAGGSGERGPARTTILHRVERSPRLFRHECL